MLALEGSSNKYLGLISVLIIVSIMTSIFATGNVGFGPGSVPELNDPAEPQVLPVVAESEDDSYTRGTRVGKNLVANGGYVNVTGGEETYFNFFAFNGTAVRFENTKINVISEDSFNDKPSFFAVTGETTTIKIINTEIHVEWGTFKIDCKNITIVDSTIHVTNKTTQEDYVDKYRANILINSTDHLTIKNSDIHAEAAEGNLDVTGGVGNVTIVSSNGITISGKKTIGILAEGGKGGDQSSRSSRLESRAGRQGGIGKLYMRAGGHVVVMDTKVIALGGLGGSGGFQNALGGNADFDLFAKGHQVSVIRSEVGSKSGLGAQSKPEFATLDTFDIRSSSFKVDEPNYLATKSGPLSTIWGNSVSFDVPRPGMVETCKMYNPHIKSVKDITTTTLNAKTDQTTIQVLFWLTAIVKDNTGSPIDEAVVTVLDNNDLDIAIKNSDASGIAEFDPIEGYTVTFTDQDGKNRIYLKATKFGAESPPDDGFYLTESMTKEVILTLLTITITGVNGDLPVFDMVVGCAVQFKGTTAKPPGTGSVDSIAVTVDGKSITPGPKDVSEDNSWAEWEYVWNSVTVTEGIHSLVFTVNLGSISKSTMLNVTVDQKSCNHPPEIIEITSPVDNIKVEDTDANPYTVIRGTAFDIDYISQIAAGEGGELAKVTIEIKDESGKLVLGTEILNDFMEYDENTGKYNWSYQWNTRLTIEGLFKFLNGNYTITVSAIDTADLVSEAWGTKNITMQVYHMVQPIAILIKVDGELLDEKREVEGFTKNKVIDFEFDGSESYDIDGNVSLLQYYWDFGDDDPEDWGSNPVITHEFEIDTSKKIQSFKVTLKVRDTDGLESTNKDSNEVEIVITYEEPPGDPVAPLNDVYSLDLKSGNMVYILIVIIVAMNVIGALVMFLSLRKITRQRAAQKALMEQQRKELEAEMAKERAESGYGDFSAEYAAEAAAQQPAAQPAVQQAQSVPKAQQPAAQAAPQPAAQAAAATAQAAAAPTPPAQPPAQPATPPAAAPAQAAAAPTHPAKQPPAEQPSADQPPAQMVGCPTCGAQIGVGATPCPSCGTALNWG